MEGPVEGKIVQNLPNQMFEIELGNGRKIKAHLGSKMKLGYTRLLPGQVVRVEISAYDAGRGRIVSVSS
jgi:translation initiation factor IF-1